MTPNHQIAKSYLDQFSVFDGQTPPIIDLFANAIPFSTVPQRMKATIAVSEIITYASQFRRNIQLIDGTEVPVNSIAFVLTGSGQNKDSSVRYARKALQPGYDLIETKRKEIAKSNAIKQARFAGEEFPEEPEIYRKYYEAVPPIFLAPSTVKGLTQHANALNRLGLSASLVYTGEFSDQLAHGETMKGLIEALSELFDLGEKEASYTQGKEGRTEAVSGQPVSALMVGSPVLILYEERVKRDFIASFMSKLARRSHFCFVPEILEEPQFDADDPDAAAKVLEYRRSIKDTAAEARKDIEDAILDITRYHLSRTGQTLPTSQDVEDMFEMYLLYNNEVAKSMTNQNSTAVLVRKHLQWKALKLAGAFAIFDSADSVTVDHYTAAIKFTELLANDMLLFETELSKFNYERFADYIQTIVNSDNVAHMSVHDMKKMGFISSTTKQKLQEFIALAATYDTSGVYSLEEDHSVIQYKRIVETNDITLSFKPIDNSRLFRLIEKDADPEMIRAAKSAIARTAQSDYTVGSTTFEDLGTLLTGDFAYTPFVFRDNVRDKDAIVSGTKFLVFDIDDSDITAEEAHFMLSDINHHVAMGSDPDNPFKFRVLIELDSVVEIDAHTWSYFYQGVAEDLSLSIDVLPQSQIFFSYSTSPVMSVTDQSTLHVRDYIMAAQKRLEEKPKLVTYSTKEKQALIEDEMETFRPAFEARMGEGSRKLIWAAKYAYKDLGMSKEDIVDLIHRINDFWIHPMPEDRLEHTVCSQILRWA